MIVYSLQKRSELYVICVFVLVPYRMRYSSRVMVTFFGSAIASYYRCICLEVKCRERKS